jgi:hypothetical protein
MTDFAFYPKLVKTTIKSHRSSWLKSIDENSKSHPQQFWKYASQYRRKNNDLIHLDVEGAFLNNPLDIAETFSTHFRSVYNSSRSCSVSFTSVNHCTANLPVTSISDADV